MLTWPIFETHEGAKKEAIPKPKKQRQELKNLQQQRDKEKNEYDAGLQLTVYSAERSFFWTFLFDAIQPKRCTFFWAVSNYTDFYCRKQYYF